MRSPSAYATWPGASSMTVERSAPAEAPKVALAILVENGGHGGSAAAPIARAVFDFAILGKLPKQASPQEAPQASQAQEEESD